MNFNELAEYQIKKAQIEGVFDNLAGAGKPLENSGYNINASARVAAGNNVIPHEIEIRKSLEYLQSQFEKSPNKDLENRIKELNSKLEIEHEAAMHFFAQD